MDFPDLDELQWLESNQQEDEDYPVEMELEQVEKNHEEKDDHFEKELCFPSPPPSSPSPQPHVPSIDNERKRPRSELEIDKDDCVRVRARVLTELEIPDENHDNCKYLSRFASEIEGDFVSITAPCDYGERVYAKLEDSFSVSVGHNFNLLANSSGLISEPIHVLMQQAEQDALLKALHDSSEVQTPFLSSQLSVMTEELWVNKYTPRSFTELLSDEQTNREVLSWLKQWDGKVFGNDIINTENEVLSALRRHSSLSSRQKRSSLSLRGKNSESSFARDSEDRTKGDEGLQHKILNDKKTQDHKVLLLCGPPGLGKTTLAHVAAKHCGYHIMEINASDDRSSSLVEAKILDAVQMNSVMAHSKPKCLVIDEIDGALGEGKGAVEVILKMIGAEKKSTSTTKEHIGSNKGHKPMTLSRPVICICNDLFAPSLRPLRSLAKVHVFAQPTVNRVVSRLKYICNKEGVKISSIALTALVEYTECDIRSCLNTLQFLHKKESLNLVALNSQVTGRKDVTKSIFDVWKEVFQKRKLKQSHKNDVGPNKTNNIYESLYSLISSRGDHELIYDGIHENFLQLHYHDPLLQKTVHCLNALGVSDLFHRCVTHSHNMSLLAYHPFIIITIHQLLARVESPTIVWPKSFHRYRSLLTEKTERLRSWQSKISPYISRHLSINSFVENTVSLLLYILSPSELKPVAVQLLSDKEKNDLARLVNTMVSYSLTYAKTKPDFLSTTSGFDGITDASSLSLDPPIQGYVNFKGCKPRYYQLTSAVKQLLMREVEKQKIVQESQAKCTHLTNNSKQEVDVTTDKANDTTKGCGIYNNEEIKKDIYIPNGQKRKSTDLTKLNSVGDTKKTPVGSFNFFDRFKKSSAKGHNSVKSSKEKSKGVEGDGHNVLFKYNEGFTNAVKRPVRIREFLQ